MQKIPCGWGGFALLAISLVYKGSVFENNVRVAKMSVSTYLPRWTDSNSEIGFVGKQVPYGSSVWIVYVAVFLGYNQYWPGGCIVFVFSFMSRNSQRLNWQWSWF